MTKYNWQWAETIVSNMESHPDYKKQICNNVDAINTVGKHIAIAFITAYPDKNKDTFSAYVAMNDRLYNINKTIHDHWQRKVSEFMTDVINAIYS